MLSHLLSRQRWLRKGRDLVCNHRERLQCVLAKGLHHRTVSGVQTAANNDPSDSRFVMPRVKGKPRAIQIHLKPGIDIQGLTDVSEPAVQHGL